MESEIVIIDLCFKKMLYMPTTGLYKTAQKTTYSIIDLLNRHTVIKVFYIGMMSALCIACQKAFGTPRPIP